MIIVVTGCEGFIGRNFTNLMLSKGHQVYGIDKLTYASAQIYSRVSIKHNNFMFIQKDINEIDYLPECDCVVNFAAESHVDNSINLSDVFVDSNFKGVKHLLELCRIKYKKPIFVQISTDEVYGEMALGSCSEEFSLQPSNPYSASKAAAEMLIIAWAKTYNVPYLIVRPSNNYGVYQYPEKLIPAVIKNYFCGRKVSLHDEGKPIRTWLHVDDTCTAIEIIINNSSVNEIYNISSPDVYNNLYVVSNIFNQLNVQFKKFESILDFIDLNYKRPGQDIRYNVNDEKLKKLGWKNEHLFEDSIEDVVEEYINFFEKGGIIF